MTWGFVGAAAITVVGGMVASNQAKQAAKGAAGAQQAAAQSGIEEQHNQFMQIKDLLAPYVNAGTSAVSSQQDLLGTNGPEAQQKAINALQGSPQFAALTQQGENSILQNASATGGLRGGNTQGALAQFRPQLLTQLIDQQYGRLGQQVQIGQAAAAGQASAGLQTGTNVANLYGNIGTAQAGGILANGEANANLTNSVFGAMGKAYGGYGKKAGWF
jgi:hypothetical protein